MSETNFARWFNHQLKRRGWSQADFVRESGVPATTVSAWARSNRIPDPDSCEEIADALNVDPDLVLIYAGHRPNVEQIHPDDPRTELLELVRRIQWSDERVQLARAMLETMVKLGKGKGER